MPTTARGRGDGAPLQHTACAWHQQATRTCCMHAAHPPHAAAPTLAVPPSACAQPAACGCMRPAPKSGWHGKEVNSSRGGYRARRRRNEIGGEPALAWRPRRWPRQSELGRRGGAAKMRYVGRVVGRGGRETGRDEGTHTGGSGHRAERRGARLDVEVGLLGRGAHLLELLQDGAEVLLRAWGVWGAVWSG